MCFVFNFVLDNVISFYNYLFMVINKFVIVNVFVDIKSIFECKYINCKNSIKYCNEWFFYMDN